MNSTAVSSVCVCVCVCVCMCNINIMYLYPCVSCFHRVVRQFYLCASLYDCNVSVFTAIVLVLIDECLCALCQTKWRCAHWASLNQQPT